MTVIRLAVVAVVFAVNAGFGVPAHAVSVDHAAWSGGDSYTNCSGGTSTFACKHIADSRYGFGQGETSPLCVESDGGLPTSTSCFAMIPATGFSSMTTKVTTRGYGIAGACLTQSAASTLNSTARIHSALLGQTFDVPVDIVNGGHTTKVSGTLNTSTGFTVTVVAHWTHGCEVSGEGVWSGTFDVSI